MSNVQFFGPKFQIESDSALIILGNSERKRTGLALAQALDKRKLFEDIEVVTLNKAVGILTRKAFREKMNTSTVFTRSAASRTIPETKAQTLIRAIPAALQIVAFNPIEPTPPIELAKGLVGVMKEPTLMNHEEGAHKTGPIDGLLAGIEMFRSPFTTLKTMVQDQFSL